MNIQHLLHNALQSYFNGGFSTLGFLTFPLHKSVSRKNKNLLKEAAKRTNTKIKGSFEQQLAQLYSIPIKPEKKKTTLIFPQFSSKKDPIYLEPVENLTNDLKRVKDLLVGLYLHGSLASGDYIKGYSDVETLVIVKDSTLQNKKKLKQLRSALYKARYHLYQIDPLQHHGHFIIAESDLLSYPESILPLAALKHAKTLLGKSSISFHIKNSKEDTKEHLEYFLNYFKSHPATYSLYEKKFFLHGVSLLPSLYLQYVDKPIYKKESFAKIKKHFSKELLEPIFEVEKIRNTWPTPKVLPVAKLLAKINPLPVYRISGTILNKRIAMDELKEEMVDLANAMEKKIQ
jgi:predicted nucleotidyltransferase